MITPYVPGKKARVAYGTLAKLGFITRIPGTLKLVSQVIGQALTWDTWQRLDAVVERLIARMPPEEVR